jgi:hypothetical protein
MAFIKSLLTGVVTLLVSALLFMIIQTFRALRMARTEMAKTGAPMEVGIDVVSLFRSPQFWILAFIAFGVGFWWQFRRAS